MVTINFRNERVAWESFDLKKCKKCNPNRQKKERSFIDF